MRFASGILTFFNAPDLIHVSMIFLMRLRSVVASKRRTFATVTPAQSSPNGGDGNVRLLAVFIGAECVANTVMEPE